MDCNESLPDTHFIPYTEPDPGTGRVNVRWKRMQVYLCVVCVRQRHHLISVIRTRRVTTVIQAIITPLPPSLLTSLPYNSVSPLPLSVLCSFNFLPHSFIFLPCHFLTYLSTKVVYKSFAKVQQCYVVKKMF